MSDWGNLSEVWTTVGTWVGALAAIAAAIGAFLAAHYARGAVGEAREATRVANETNETTKATLEDEREREVARQEEATREQARQVSAWLVVTVPLKVEDPSDRIVEHGYVRIRNGSVEPVYDVAAFVHLEGSNVLPEPFEYGSLEPGGHRDIGLTHDRSGDTAAPGAHRVPSVSKVIVRLAFRDAGDRRWLREASGVLVRDPERGHDSRDTVLDCETGYLKPPDPWDR